MRSKRKVLGPIAQLVRAEDSWRKLCLMRGNCIRDGVKFGES